MGYGAAYMASLLQTRMDMARLHIEGFTVLKKFLNGRETERIKTEAHKLPDKDWALLPEDSFAAHEKNIRDATSRKKKATKNKEKKGTWTRWESRTTEAQLGLAKNPLVRRLQNKMKKLPSELAVAKVIHLKSNPTDEGEPVMQHPHEDYVNTHLTFWDGDEVPLGLWIAVQEESTLRVWPFTIKRTITDGDRSWQNFYMDVTVSAGDAILFRGDLVHSGFAYSHLNFRLHAYLEIQGREVSRAPNNELSFVHMPSFIKCEGCRACAAELWENYKVVMITDPEYGKKYANEEAKIGGDWSPPYLPYSRKD